MGERKKGEYGKKMEERGRIVESDKKNWGVKER